MTTHDLQDRLSDLEAELEAYKRAKAENDECYMIERDQARLELQSLKAQVADREKLANEVTDTAETLTEELQSLKAQCAAMRSALEFGRSAAHQLLSGQNLSLTERAEMWTLQTRANAALSSTPPSSPRSLGATYHGPYVSREAVLPVAQALRAAIYDPYEGCGCEHCKSLEAALAYARELGLLEDK